jgi:hypothetical protein
MNLKIIGGGEGERKREGQVAQTMYPRVSKCKHDKIKERKKLLKIKY